MKNDKQNNPYANLVNYFAISFVMKLAVYIAIRVWLKSAVKNQTSNK